MIRITGAYDIFGKQKEITIESTEEFNLDAKGLTALPAAIDPHVHFRTPGEEHKEDWISGAHAALAGGVTTVFDMPNNTPACITKEHLEEKCRIIESQLQKAEIPLHYKLFFGADKNNLKELSKVKNAIAGLKVFMSASTGDLLMNDAASLEKAFRIAAENDVIIAIHAEDEGIIKVNRDKYGHYKDPAIHSMIRSRKAASTAVRKAISLCEKYQGRLYILHISSTEEVDIIQQAKDQNINIFCETTPQHLFFNEEAYLQLGTCILMNPPLRLLEDQRALWRGIHNGTIDAIGTDHSPHTLEEKKQPYSNAPIGVPGIETLLPLLLNAYNEGKLTLKKLSDITNRNILQIFDLGSNDDIVLVDLNKKQTVSNDNLHTKCRWSPYSGMELKGWPIYMVLQDKIYSCKNSKQLNP